RGGRDATFKGQNMSKNARVVAGGEIGVAQYLQALAAGLEPDVRMNPVLVKPEGERRSQVVVDGRPDLTVSAMPWRGRGPALWPPIERALRSLLADFELVVIEGAGSPAEINLRDTDLTNMRVALAADAPVVLVADIDRGGAFAHLYGTWSLVPDSERAAIRAFVLNKFRGDASLLAPAPADLAWLREHGLADAIAARAASGGRIVAVCGGLQMLGDRLHDDAGVDGSAEGLGLLPLVTLFQRDKLTRHLDIRFDGLCEPWDT